MGVNQSKISYEATATTTLTTRRPPLDTSAITNSSSRPTTTTTEPLDPTLLGCTTRHGIADPTTSSNYNGTIRNSSDKRQRQHSSTEDSGYVGSTVMFPQTSTITDLCGLDETQTSSVIVTAATALTTTSSSSPPSYSNYNNNNATTTTTTRSSRPPINYRLCVDDILQELAAASPHETNPILDAVFATARQLDDPRDHAAAFRAAQIWSKQTNDDDASNVAAVWVARCLLDGWGMRGHAKEGFDQLQQLAGRGCWQAFFPLGLCYLHGVAHVQPPDKTLALTWFSTTAQLDPDKTAHARSVIALAQLHVGALTLQENHLGEAFTWFLKSANIGNAHAQFLVAIYYALGCHTKKDWDLAKRYLHKSAEQDFSRAQADLGIMLVKDHMYVEGLQWLERAEQAQDPRALYQLGLMYEHGDGVDQSNERALFYLKGAAEHEHVLAQYRLALHYLDGGIGLEPNLQKTDQFLRQAAHAGHPPAQRRLGCLYLEGLGPPSTTDHVRLQQYKSNKIAMEWFNRAAVRGDMQAYVLIGECYEKGRGVHVNQKTALEYYRKAAETKSTYQMNGQYALAELLFRTGQAGDAFDWYKRASSHQHVEASFLKPIRRAKLMVARYYLHGWAHVNPDKARAFQMLNELSDHDGDSAHYWLASCYLEGIPGVCEVDTTVAFKYYMKAAKAGHMDSQFEVAYMLAHGNGTMRNREEALLWYKKAANKGHPVAIYTLGLHFLHNVRNLNKAMIYFERAADLGHTESMERLAEIYLMDIARPISSLDRAAKRSQEQRCKQALAWIKRAAERGHRVAQRELGKLHDRALGVPEDHQKAFELFSCAAQQNDTVAILLLGSYYEHGQGVPQDVHRALEHYLRAASLGSERASFAAGQLYHKLHRFQEAYVQYKIAAKDKRLRGSVTGKTARLMVARYVLLAMVSNPEETKEEAFEMLHDLVLKDEFSPSFYWHGYCCHHGLGTAVQLEKAIHWYNRAAEEAKDTQAMVQLANLYEQESPSSEEDDMRIIQCLKRAAELGDAEGQYKLGMAHWRGLQRMEIDKIKAAEWFKQSASQGYGMSHWALGQMFLENGDRDMALLSWDNGVRLENAASMRSQAQLLLTMLPETAEQDRRVQYTRAMKLLTDAAHQGDAESHLYLGRIYVADAAALKQRAHAIDGDLDEHTSNDIMVLLEQQKQQEERAKNHLEIAAKEGQVEAMFLAGQIWHEQSNYLQANKYYQQAADAGYMLARVMRARYRLAEGLPGIVADPEAGFKELMACAQEQCSSAYHSLGQCYELGLGVQQDYEKALEWYSRSVETTADAEAVFRIGRIHARDHKELDACRWYELACHMDNTHARAHYHLGLYYLHGVHDTIQRDFESAVYHLQQAIRQNDYDAMFELGILYLSDDMQFTVEQQLDGFAYLEHASQLGSCDAQRELGKLYHTGKDYCPSIDDTGIVTIVPQQLDRAFDLFCQAAEQGDRSAALFVGTFYEHGIHVSADPSSAAQWYDIAIRLDLQQPWWVAELALARVLHQDPSQRSRAYQLFQAAFEHAETDEQRSTAEIMMARYRLHGWGDVSIQDKVAMMVLLRYARAGEARVFYEVAWSFERGLGVDQDLKQAFIWYSQLEQLASTLTQEEEELLDDDLQQDITNALVRLVEFYRCGWTTRVDLAKATTLENQIARRTARVRDL